MSTTTTSSNMTPIGIPPSAARANPNLRAKHVGPPPGIGDDECGTPEVLVGVSPEGYPVYADYWRPTVEQLALLNGGGYIELRQYAQQMAMHSLTIHSADSEENS